MFTGIIEEVGAVSRRWGPNIAIMAKVVLEDLKVGDSIAVDGTCLTATAVDAEGFVAQASPETIERTTLSSLRAGDAVNLERAMAAGGRFGGHFVLGHVDGVGRIASVQPQGDFSLWRFQAEASVARYLVPKGSVAVDGMSLTVVEPMAETFGVAIIPATIELTTLGRKRPGDSVNLEADVIGKHVYHYVKGLSEPGQAPRDGITKELLGRTGFL